MVICDLEGLEVVTEEDWVEGGKVIAAGSVASASLIAGENAASLFDQVIKLTSFIPGILGSVFSLSGAIAQSWAK